MTLSSALTRMSGRDRDETHRTSTPLELLFDLTFVVAVSQSAAALNHGLVEAHLARAVTGYLMVFFAIWWAWMGFTWFGSAYDTDDAGYRLLTLLQMGGVLVLAAGVEAASDGDYRVVTTGYVVMRVAVVGQWARAAVGDPSRRSTALRYVLGIILVQAGWVARLALPENLGTVSFLVLGAAELAVPLWAERTGATPWHPHHVAERYGLFTIIVLGEAVLASTVALQGTATGSGSARALLGGGALVLLFLLWWLYFLEPAGEGLERRPALVWIWGYGHYAVFAALAALGSGLEAVAQTLGEDERHVSDLVLAYAVTVPVVVFLLVLWALHAPLGGHPRRDLTLVVATCLILLTLASATTIGLPLPWCVLLLCVPVAALTVRAATGHTRRTG